MKQEAMCQDGFAEAQVNYHAAGMIAQDDKSYFNVNGMMIYDPSIQYPVTSEVAALPFVDGEQHIRLSIKWDDG